MTPKHSSNYLINYLILRPQNSGVKTSFAISLTLCDQKVHPDEMATFHTRGCAHWVLEPILIKKNQTSAQLKNSKQKEHCYKKLQLTWLFCLQKHADFCIHNIPFYRAGQGVIPIRS